MGFGVVGWVSWGLGWCGLWNDVVGVVGFRKVRCGV